MAKKLKSELKVIMDTAMEAYGELLNIEPAELPRTRAQAKKYEDDYLARFIAMDVNEIVGLTPHSPVHGAIEGLERARDQLKVVIEALEDICDGNGRVLKEMRK